jgi:hypothetical protein
VPPVTMPTFTDGTIPTASILNTLATGINNLGTLLTGIAATRQFIPSSSAYINTTHAIPTSADTIVSFDTTTINDDYLWIPSVGHPVVNTAGNYICWAQVNFDYNATGIRAAHLLLNGTSVASNSIAAGSGNPANVVGNIGTAFLCISPPVALAVGANVYLSVFQSSGGPLNLIPNESGTSLSLIRIGD